MTEPTIDGYRWQNAKLNCSHAYLVPALLNELERLSPEPKRIFELGCGNGSIANLLAKKGWDVTGVDPSTEGIAQAHDHYPNLKLAIGSAYDDLAAEYGQFSVVTSLEVVEHVYAPRHFAATLYSLLEPAGTAIISTPYHGYLKNLALALTGKMDKHFTVLWDHGHIKFWSMATLSELLREAGFQQIRFLRVGRVPSLAKSMIAIAQRPNA